MGLSLGFVSFILLNCLVLAEFIDGKYYFAEILVVLAVANLIVLTLTCKQADH